MAAQSKVRVAVNGYGVIGKRVAHAITLQDDMTLTGVVDVVNDWRARVATQHGLRLFAANAAAADAMRSAGMKISGTLEDVLGDVDLVVDCTPKKIAGTNAELYRKRGIRFIVEGGEKHALTGHSFVAESNYASAIGRNATRVVSCNTTSIVRTLTALKRAGLLLKARGTLLAARDRSMGKPLEWHHEYVGAGGRDPEPSGTRRANRRWRARRGDHGGQGA